MKLYFKRPAQAQKMETWPLKEARLLWKPIKSGLKPRENGDTED